METKHGYTARGTMIAYLWSGPKGAYPTKNYTAATRQELEKLLQDTFDNGTMKTGDFQGLKGAVFSVERTDTITVDGKEFSRTEYEDSFTVGEVTPEEMDWLFEIETYS